MRKYKLDNFIDQLPRTVSVKALCTTLEKKGILRDTFFRDRRIEAKSKTSIPEKRLSVYAQLFGCTIDELLNYKPRKIKSVIK